MWATRMLAWRDALTEVETAQAALAATTIPVRTPKQGWVVPAHSAHHKLGLHQALAEAQERLKVEEGHIRTLIKAPVVELSTHPVAGHLCMRLAFQPYPKGREMMRPKNLPCTGAWRDHPWIALRLGEQPVQMLEPDVAETVITHLRTVWDALGTRLSNRAPKRAWDVQWGRRTPQRVVARSPEGAAIKAAILTGPIAHIPMAIERSHSAQVRAVLHAL